MLRIGEKSSQSVNHKEAFKGNLCQNLAGAEEWSDDTRPIRRHFGRNWQYCSSILVKETLAFDRLGEFRFQSESRGDEDTFYPSVYVIL